MSFLRFVFHWMFPDPKPGQVWVLNDGDPFRTHSITITSVKDGWCEYFLTKYGEAGLRHTNRLRNLKAFYKLQPQP